MPRQKKPRKINYKPKGIPCAECKWALPVDAKHNKYYCTNEELGYSISRGTYICSKGEEK